MIRASDKRPMILPETEINRVHNNLAAVQYSFLEFGALHWLYM